MAASFAFYAAWRIEYFLLLLATAITCHYAALAVVRLPRTWHRRSLLAGTLGINLGILFLFKYYGLFAQSVNYCFGSGVPLSLGLLLPVGISFYTFQAIGYFIDVYQSKIVPERSFARTLLFISFFPQLVAGPIERAGHLIPELRQPIWFRWRNFRTGLGLIAWGLFKKVVIADRLSLLVDHVYDDPSVHSAALILLATHAFAFQIYCDFSGYSDMAIGSAKLFGIELMQNFRSPYFAASIREFWTRWHISLSTWFRDYVYLPLGGNRVTSARWSMNIILVFAVSGLWHGAQWTYVVWGLIHGFVLIGEALLSWLQNSWLARGKPDQDPARVLNEAKRTSSLSKTIRQVLKIALTYHLVLLGWVFFRSSDLQSAGVILTTLSDWRAYQLSLELPDVFSRFELAIAVLAVVWMLVVEIATSSRVERVPGFRPRWKSRFLAMVTLLLILNFGIFSHPTQFVYFQF